MGCLPVSMLKDTYAVYAVFIMLLKLIGLNDVSNDIAGGSFVYKLKLQNRILLPLQELRYHESRLMFSGSM